MRNIDWASPPARSICLASAAAALIALIGLAPASLAAAPASASEKSAQKSKPMKRAPQRKAAPKAPAPPGAASPEQLEAAERVYYGAHQCEFGKAVDVAINADWPGYVDVTFGNLSYLMRPVLSSTGAVRLEDVKNETLMVQIMSKSMLMNARQGRRMVDECVSEKHREAMELVKRAQEAALAADAARVSEEAPPPTQ
jgi:hypothetical protein